LNNAEDTTYKPRNNPNNMMTQK